MLKLADGKKDKILVTGHTGYIGRILTQKLQARGEEVVGFSRSTGHDLLDQGQLFKALDGCNRVYHLAAKVDFNPKHERETRRTNIIGTSFLLQSIGMFRYIEKIVFVSSAITCGLLDDPSQVMDEHDFITNAAVNPYVFSKSVGEKMCIDSRLPVVIVLPTTAQVMHTRFAPPGGCNIIDARDVVSGMIAAMDLGRLRERYLLSDINITFRKLHPRAIPVPRWSKRICKRFANPFLVENSFRYKYYTNEKAKKELQWTPQHEPIKNFTIELRPATSKPMAGGPTSPST